MSNVIELDAIAFKSFEVGYFHPKTGERMDCGVLKAYHIPDFIERMEQAGLPAYVGGDLDQGVTELMEYLSVDIDEQDIPD
jgi:hypothetical protein